jgi:hypothetical protein
MCWPALEELSWTFVNLDILLSWAYSFPLISLAWLLIQSEIEWSKCIVLVSLHLSGTWMIFGCGILVSLGGCCHLDGLEQQRSCGKSGAYSWSPPDDLWGVLCLPRRSAKGNSSKLLVSLSYLTCSRFLKCSWGAWLCLPISCRTTRCRSTQRGLACLQAREPREKNCVSPLLLIYWISFDDWYSSYYDWFIPRHGGIKITSPPFTFCKVVVTSSLV